MAPPLPCPPGVSVKCPQPEPTTAVRKPTAQKGPQVAYAPTAPLDRKQPSLPSLDRIYDEIYSLEEVQSLRQAENDIPVLIVQGVVVNKSRSPRAVPPLVAVVSDRGGKELKRWTFNAEAETLGPGASTGFRSESFDPTSDAVKVTITFAPVLHASE